MSEISIDQKELEVLEKKIAAEKANLSDEDANFLESLIKKANAAKALENVRDVGWFFKWTYRF